MRKKYRLIRKSDTKINFDEYSFDASKTLNAQKILLVTITITINNYHKNICFISKRISDWYFFQLYIKKSRFEMVSRPFSAFAQHAHFFTISIPLFVFWIQSLDELSATMGSEPGVLAVFGNPISEPPPFPSYAQTRWRWWWTTWRRYYRNNPLVANARFAIDPLKSLPGYPDNCAVYPPTKSTPWFNDGVILFTVSIQFL